MDLIFNVAQLMKEAVGAQRSYDFAEPALELSEPLAGEEAALIARNVRGRIRFTRLNGRLRAVGQVQATVELHCSRCLDPFTVTVGAPLDEIFMQTYDVTSGLPLRREEGEDDAETFTIDRNHLVDLSELIRQTLLINLPLQPLCRADCQGLCPHCGQNWNDSPCDCPADTMDPRLAVLADLLTDERIANRFSPN